MSFGHLQERRLINILEQPVLVFDHPYTKKSFPKQYLAFCMLFPLPLVLSLSSIESVSILLSAPSQVFICSYIPLNLLFSKLNSLELSSQEKSFNCLIDFVTLGLTDGLEHLSKVQHQSLVEWENQKGAINWWRNTRECLNNSVENNPKQQWQWFRNILERY